MATTPDIDRLRESFHAEGYVVLRGIVPAALVRDLRRVAERARELARAQHGEQAQRLQPVMDADLDRGPIRDYLELPALHDAVVALLSPRHRHATADKLGMLFEPARGAWATGWHRDWRDNVTIDPGLWRRRRDDLDLFNQVNCALYEDSCTWIVPGSHRRDDLPGEAAFNPPDLDGLGDVDVEIALRAHCRRMPGALRLDLGPGDYALYRNTLWHLGCYLPYQRRATLHDAVDTPAYRHWWDVEAPAATRPPSPAVA